MMAEVKKIAVIAGDGIGPEVVAEAEAPEAAVEATAEATEATENAEETEG